MQADLSNILVSKKRFWTGWVISVLFIALLTLDGVAKLFKPAPVVEATVKLGYPESVIVSIGVILLICVVLYAIPRTAILGAILLTGYLGGAVATHVRVGESLFSMIFPVIIGILIWGGIYLRDPRLSKLIPLRS